jgi:hypothetical protein
LNVGSLWRAAGGQPAPVGGLGGWAVGAQASFLPEGLARYLPKGADLILATHFHPSGKAEKETSTVGIYFADRTPTKQFTGIQLPPLFGVFKGIDIPAGEKEYTIEDSFTLPVNVKAFGVSAHAHYLAKQMKMTAQLPDGRTKTLLWISDWDFAWQDQYQFKDFVSLPKGTRLDVKITYDNSADNPRNPAIPPTRVRWGEGSNDEMGSVSLMAIAENEADMPQLRQTYREHLRLAFVNRKGMPFIQRREGQWVILGTRASGFIWPSRISLSAHCRSRPGSRPGFARMAVCRNREPSLSRPCVFCIYCRRCFPDRARAS